MEYVEGVPEYKFHSTGTEEKILEPEDKSLSELDFDEIYDKYSKLAYGLAYERLRDIHVVEDIVQEVFLRLSKEIEDQSFDSEKHAKGWLLRATSNLCTDVLRRRALEKYTSQRQKQIKSYVLEDTIDKMIEEMEAQERVDRVFRKLKRKKSKWYKVARGFYCSGKTNGQLAEEFDMTYAGMGMLINRIRKWLGWELFKQNPELKQLYPKEFEELEIENQKKKSAKKKKDR